MANGNPEDDPQADDLRTGLSSFSTHDHAASRLLSSRPWMTPVIIGINVVVFAAMAALFQTVTGFDPVQLIVSGGNSAALDLSGQWWRLASYQFLHANILHIAVNMWVLWSVGRLTERLYGSFNLGFLYLLSGVLGGLASIVWNPEQVSVGASGSIFGILGAFFAFLIRYRDETPTSVLRYWLPALVFTGYNLFAGASEPSVDNAAHVGGLIGGFLAGIILAKEPVGSRGFSFLRAATALVLTCVVALPALWYLDAFNRSPSTLEAFTANHRWYMDSEGRNLQLWMTLGTQLSSGTISTDAAEKGFEQNIIPFWQNANARYQTELKQPAKDQNPFLAPVAKFVELRLAWAQAIADALRNASPDGAQSVIFYSQQILPIQSEIDRLKLRSEAESIPTPLSQSAAFIAIRRALPELGPACVEAPAFMQKPVSATDAAADGPAQRHAIGCEAQKMFLTGDYQSLDRDIKKYSRTLSDLPDGSSHLEGIWVGIYDLLDYGQITVEETMRRLAQWRRTVKGSPEPDLVEADMFRVWAYSARGHGYASSVTAQAMQIFSARSLMASASLRAAAPSGAYDPMWYILAIGNDRDQAISPQIQQAVFELSMMRFRGYLPLYRQMLTSLMPRWDGSTEAVDLFVRSAATTNGVLDPASYARLYLIYGDLEGGDFNVVDAAHADPALIDQGMAALRIQYPRSDYIWNATARFACIDRQWALYRSLRPRLAPSSQAWPDKLSVARCDALSR